MAFTLTPDGSLLDDERVIYFSISRFLQDICEASHCFVCGIPAGTVAFNQEHVLPDWLLRRHNLSTNTVGLPNGARLTYSKYKVPCCVTCNSNLGRLLETPVSAVLATGYDNIKTSFDQRMSGLLYVWMCLIYFKTHYKDLFLKIDLRKPLVANQMADHYDFADLHHVHCMARVAYSGPAVDSVAAGSLMIFHAATEPGYEHFDFLDLHEARALLVRTGDVAIIAVLNDASICQRYMGPLCSRLTGPLTPMQLRELLAHVAAINLSLPERPEFSSRVSADGTYQILANVPETPPVIEMDETMRTEFGRLLEFVSEPFFKVPFRGLSTDEARAQMREGAFTFLFNDDGSFNSNSFFPAGE
jgi:hypothetical protein